MGKKLLNLCLTAMLCVVSTAAWALSEVNGVYQIGTAEDLQAFAELVNGENPYACAVLTADIVKPATDVSMIGRDGQDFQGTFDGQGHTITIDMYSQGEQGSALFRNIGVQAVVQRLKVQGTITTNQKLAAGIAVWSGGIVRDCYIDITVKSSFVGDATHAGIVAVGNRGLVVENCLAKFNVQGKTTQNCGGLVGWLNNPVNIVNSLVISDGSDFDTSNGGSNNIARNDGNLKVVDLTNYNANIYANRPGGASYNNYVTKQWGNNKATTVVPYDDLADGRICYQLNNDQSRIGWVQTIGVDPFPVPAPFGSGQVYASATTDCDGKTVASVTYSNSGSVQATQHSFDKYGVCSKCGCFNFHAFEFDDPEKFDPATRTISLYSADDIYMAEGWNRICNGLKLNMKMENDIEIIPEAGQYIFNTSEWVDGSFDGDGHTLTYQIADVGSNAAFFPNFTGTFENVILHGEISTTGQFAGSAIGRSKESTAIVRNVFSDMTINANKMGDNTTAGLVGCADKDITFENCIYAGDINGIAGTESIAGICGWASGELFISNSAFLGTLSNAGGDSQTISRNPTKIHSTNVYSLESYSYGNGSDEGKYILYDNIDGIEDGELAFFLNGKQGGVERFYQKIGEDIYPMPIAKEGALIYANAPEYSCDGSPIGSTTYGNVQAGDPVIPDHTYEGGFCEVCGHMQEDFLTPVDGWFEISNGAELLWWSHYASKNLGASARLTDDIDMDEYSDRWPDIGTRNAPFYGCFDGQYHTISNLNIYRPGTDGVGLIGIMNSQPSKAFGGIDGDEARASEGTYIKNVVLDESCSIYAHGYAAIVGMTASWAGHITFEGVMMLGDVTVDGGKNGGGILGCVMDQQCRVTINNCGMIGDIHALNNGDKENGSFSGWIGDYAELTNCFAIGEVDNIDPNRGFARHGGGRYNNGYVVIKNCYALDGIGIKQEDDGGTKEDVSFVKREDLETGAITWLANGSQFRNPVWFQTLGEDQYPYPYPTHGVVIHAAEEYFSVLDEEEVVDVVSAVQSYEEEKMSDVIATQSLLDDLEEMLESMSDIETVLELADAMDTLAVRKDSIAANAAVYDEYISKCEEVKGNLEADQSFSGSIRDALEYYLTEADEPDENNPLGTYEYIKDIHEATSEEIKAETQRVVDWYAAAIAENIVAGTDVSNLIPNFDFSKKNESWENGFANSWGEVANTQTQVGKVVGVEAWDATGDMYQTIENMQPGYYLVSTHGAFRPSDKRYSTNYAAGIYANGIFNYFPTVIEDYVAANDTIDQENCNLHGNGAHDLEIYDDNFSTSKEQADDNGASLAGFATRGETGMAAAANADRYPVHTIAYVGEDGKLTIGIKNPGTQYGQDWTGWSALKVTYCGAEGDVAEDALDLVLENMGRRAETIIDYIFDDEVAGLAPNFPEALREQLSEKAQNIGVVSSVEDKAQLAKDLSDLFQQIYEAKQAYIKLWDYARVFETLDSNPALVEKDETGVYYETGEFLFSEAESEALYGAYEELIDAYYSGSYSTEEALNPAIMQDETIASILPATDETGTYLISNPKQFYAFNSICTYLDENANAKLTNDIDMAGISMTPIGTSDTRYRGVFDGQNYALANLYINRTQRPAGLFNIIENATVKNLKLTGDFYSSDKFIGGITGYTYGDCVIENCDVAVNIHTTVSGDGTHGGLIGVLQKGTALVNNSIVNCPMFGENTNSCGGVCGWIENGNHLDVKNTLILSQGSTIDTSTGCHTVSRNDGNCSIDNVFFVEAIGTVGGTKVTAEQLASGEVAYKLNRSKSEGDLAWFQTIGTDTIPRLYEGAIVYYYGGKYMNDKPNPQLNAFAYNLDAKLSGNKVTVSYTLNAEAESVAVNFYDGETLVYTAVSNEVGTAGAHSVDVPVSNFNGADVAALNYEVAVTGKGSLDILQIGESYKFNSPYGLAVNNNPASEGFGQVLVTESRPTEDHTGMFSENNPGALFAFDAAFEPVGAYYGGLDIPSQTPVKIYGDEQLGLKDVRFSKDGRLFVGSALGTSNSSVWEINPDNLEQDWTPVFTGGELDDVTGITYVDDEEQNRMAVGLALEGEGEDLKLYVLGAQRSNGEANPTDYNCAVYNLGTATEWSTVPSDYITAFDTFYSGLPTHVGINEDGRGGLWFVQSTEGMPSTSSAIMHLNAEGAIDYNLTNYITYSGKMAVTNDGEYFALPQGNNRVVLYECTYVPNPMGMILPVPKFVITTTESSITGMAFDYANNLYVASSGTKTLSRYVIPSLTNNLSVTPGKGIGEGASGDLNGDGAIDISDAVVILDAMASDAPDMKYDLNGDNAVDISDFVVVLDLMAQQ